MNYVYNIIIFNNYFIIIKLSLTNDYLLNIRKITLPLQNKQDNKILLNLQLKHLPNNLLCL